MNSPISQTSLKNEDLCRAVESLPSPAQVSKSSPKQGSLVLCHNETSVPPSTLTTKKILCSYRWLQGGPTVPRRRFIDPKGYLARGSPIFGAGPHSSAGLQGREPRYKLPKLLIIINNSSSDFLSYWCPCRCLFFLTYLRVFQVPWLRLPETSPPLVTTTSPSRCSPSRLPQRRAFQARLPPARRQACQT